MKTSVSGLSPLDRLQVSMFQTLFKLRRDEMGNDMAFATAIADTSDENFERCKRLRPDLVDRWLREYGGVM